MAFPPPTLPTNRSNATPQQNTHSADHNSANAAINDTAARLTARLQWSSPTPIQSFSPWDSSQATAWITSDVSLVFVRGRFTRTSQNLPQGHVFGVLAASFRPNTTLWVPVMTGDGTNVSANLISIGTDGNMTLLSAATGVTALSFTILFPKTSIQP